MTDSNLNPQQFRVRKTGGPGEYETTFGHEIRSKDNGDFGSGTVWTVSNAGSWDVDADPFNTKKDAVDYARTQVEKHASGEWDFNEHIKALLGKPHNCNCPTHQG